VAEAIIEGMKGVDGTETVLQEVKSVDSNTIPSYDAIVIGSPNHMGGPTRGVKKFIDKLSSLSLEGKQFAVFDTYGGGILKKRRRKWNKECAIRCPR